MATTKFNITELIAMSPMLNYIPAFGTAINKLISTRDEIEYKIALQKATEIALGYKVNTVGSMKDYGKNEVSAFAGMPLFQPLILIATEVGEANLLLDSAVVTWNLPRNIITTIVQGRDNSVDEFINNGDYVINVSGIICSSEWKYPLEKVVELDKFVKKKQALKIEHEILNALGVFKIIINSYDCPKTPSINCQQYNFTAKSSQPLELKSKDTNTFFKI